MLKLISFTSVAFLSLISLAQPVFEGSSICIESGINEIQVQSSFMGPLDSCNTLVLGANLDICELTQIKGFVSGLPQSAQEGLVFDFYTDAPNFQGNGIRYVHPNALAQFGSSYLFSACPTVFATLYEWNFDAADNLIFPSNPLFDAAGSDLSGSWQVSISHVFTYLDFGSIALDFNGSCNGCSSTPGCTDSNASNFDPDATEDDGSCDYGCPDDAATHVLSVGGGTYDDEISWALIDPNGNSVETGGAGSSFTVCLEPGCYTLRMLDSYGDGWNGAMYTLYDEFGNTSSGSLDSNFEGDGQAEGFDVLRINTSSSCIGCTDPVACNYQADVIFEDGSCVYAESDWCDCEGNAEDECGVCGGNGFAGCIEISACNYNPNASCSDGSCEYLSCIEFGCLNPDACNYNENADVDNESCEFESCCLLSTSVTGIGLTGGQSDTATQFIGYGALDSISFSLDFVNLTSDASWAADVAILIQPPGNPCYAFGGFNLDSNCVSVGDWQVVWPEWANAASGTYMVTLSLESFNIDGDGLWSINVLNGFTGSGGVDYTLDATLYGVCPPGPNDDVFGCTDALACNFNPFATTDDASCYPCGCTYPNACNYNPDALEDDGSCLYPVDLGVCDCAGSIEDALGVCGGTCDSDQDNDGICDDIDDCIGVLDACGICNGPGAIYECGCADLEPGACDCNGTPCGTVTQLLEVENPFLDLPYVQGASPFISVYEGWLDANFITVGIHQPGLNLTGGNGSTNYDISIAHGDADAFTTATIPVQAGVQFASEFVLDLSQFSFTAADILGVRLLDNNGSTLDRLFVSGVPLPEVTIGDIDMAPGQHRLVRQPWVLQGRLNLEEDEWLVCDENEAVPFYSAWDLESTISVPLAPGSEACLNDQDGDGVCDELELPVYCQDVNSTNYSPLQNTLICEDAEVLEFWMSSFTLDQGVQTGNLTPASPLSSPQALSSMAASNSCSAGASQLAFCNTGQRAFVVDENNKSVRIVDYGNLSSPASITDASGNGWMDITPLEISIELTAAGVSDWESLVPLDVDIYNTIVGPDDTSFCCSLMVAVAWMDTASLANPGWISFHDSNGALIGSGVNDIYEVGPSPRSLSFSEDGSWLVVACSGEGEFAASDPKGEVVCVDVSPWTQSGDLSSIATYAFPLDHDGAPTITGAAARTNPAVYGGSNSSLAYQLEPSHVAITPDESRAYVNCQVNNAIVEINLDNVVSPGTGVISGVYGFGTRDMSGTGFDGKDDGSAVVETSSENVVAWYQPGDIEIISDGVTTLLLTANEGKPTVDGMGAEDMVPSTSSEFGGLLIDSEYGFGATGNSAQPSYVFGARSFSAWNISAGGAPSLWYDSGPIIEETLANLMPDYANSRENAYSSGDEASVGQGPKPSGITHGLVDDEVVAIVSLEEMGGSMIFNLKGWTNPGTIDALYQAYATNRDFQNPTMDQCIYNHLGAEDVYFLPSEVTSYTGVTGVNEGYDAILVSNDETGSLTLFSLASTLDIPGCTDSCACNYNSNATLNDGSCEFSSCGGCTYVEALNYDASATLEDGSCTFEDDCPGDFDNDNSVTTADLLSFLTFYGTACP